MTFLAGSSIVAMSSHSIENRCKTRKISRRHKKGASRAAIRDEAVKFDRAFAQLETQVADTSAERLSVPADMLIALSQIAVAAAIGEVIKALPSAVIAAKEHLPTLVEPLIEAVQGGRASIAAFRKIVGAERLMQTADLLNSMRTEETLAEWRRRHSVRISLRSQMNTSGSAL